MSNLLKKEKGFTLIEIVLVLAIAGLIMVIVFLAVSGAQKSRRDAQRKSDAARILSQLEQYASNNQGAYPAAVAPFWATYITAAGNFNDPSTGNPYTATYGTAAPAAAGAVSFSANAQCTLGNITAGGGNRVAAVEIFTEQGGHFCVDNH